MSVAEFTKPIKVVKKKIKKIIEEEKQDEPIDTNISAKDKSRYMVASQLSQLGISHDQGRHHDVIVLADSYKKILVSIRLHLDFLQTRQVLYNLYTILYHLY
jgi:hypothetical protein